MTDVTQTTTSSTDDEEHETDADVDADSHLDDIEEGAGCTEIWEHLSEQRDD